MDGNTAMNSEFENMSEKDMEEQIKLDEFHFHEAADRSHIIIGMIQDYILDHPVFCQVQELKEKAEKAQELFSEIYQDIANVEEKQLSRRRIEDGSELWQREYDWCRGLLQNIVNVSKDNSSHAVYVLLGWYQQAEEFLSKYQHFDNADSSTTVSVGKKLKEDEAE